MFLQCSQRESDVSGAREKRQLDESKSASFLAELPLLEVLQEQCQCEINH